MDKEKAIKIAVRQLDFKPECVQVRFLRRGFRSYPYWIVSLWTLDARKRFERVTLVEVDARTGKVARVTRHPSIGGTQPQCASPV